MRSILTLPHCGSNFLSGGIMKNSFSVFLLTFSVLTALMLPVSALFPTPSDAELYDEIIRLHVIANSDSTEDQELKLKVRDGVLAAVSELLYGISDRNAAEAAISKNLAVIESAARDVITSEGESYGISVSFSEESYPTRTYGEFSLPAGTYTSLRVLIGEAGGKNWWCMLYPSLCVGAVTETKGPVIFDGSEFIEAGLTPGQVRIITGSTPDIKIKFRLLEFFEGLFS